MPPLSIWRGYAIDRVLGIFWLPGLRGRIVAGRRYRSLRIYRRILVWLWRVV